MPMTEGTAEVTVKNFSDDGKVTFRIVASCADSDGNFQYTYTYLDDRGIQHELDKRQTWIRTHDEDDFTVDDEIDVKGGSLLSVNVFESTCQCYEDP